MPDYAPTTQPGATRRRIARVEGLNPLAGAPGLVFFESEVIRTGSGTERVLADTGALAVAYQPGAMVPLRDPQTDAIIGQIAHDAIFAGLYSLGRAAQAARDAETGAG